MLQLDATWVCGRLKHYCVAQPGVVMRWELPMANAVGWGLQVERHPAIEARYEWEGQEVGKHGWEAAFRAGSSPFDER